MATCSRSILKSTTVKFVYIVLNERQNYMHLDCSATLGIAVYVKKNMQRN